MMSEQMHWNILHCYLSNQHALLPLAETARTFLRDSAASDPVLGTFILILATEGLIYLYPYQSTVPLVIAMGTIP